MTASKASKAAAAKAEEESQDASAQQVEAPAQETERQKRARLKTQATNTLIESHRDEFNKLAENLFSENGLEFKRRLTDEEKAEKELDDLLAKNPALRDKLAAKAAEGGEHHSGELNLSVSAESLTGDGGDVVAPPSA